MRQNWLEKALFTIGDYLAGATVGALTALAARALVAQDTDMVLAMLVGMGVGMVIHLVIGLLLTPLLGAFHTMVPGSVIGMYGGMFFGMRDSMQDPASVARSIATGAVFGVVVIAAIHLYDRALRAGNCRRLTDGPALSSEMGPNKPDVRLDDVGR